MSFIDGTTPQKGFVRLDYAKITGELIGRGSAEIEKNSQKKILKVTILKG